MLLNLYSRIHLWMMSAYVCLSFVFVVFKLLSVLWRFSRSPKQMFHVQALDRTVFLYSRTDLSKTCLPLPIIHWMALRAFSFSSSVSQCQSDDCRFPSSAVSYLRFPEVSSELIRRRSETRVYITTHLWHRNLEYKEWIILPFFCYLVLLCPFIVWPFPFLCSCSHVPLSLTSATLQLQLPLQPQLQLQLHYSDSYHYTTLHYHDNYHYHYYYN